MSIVNYLFETNAVQVAKEGEVFLTTSGLITPYYVNTHFLCGGESESLRLLNLIDSFKGSPEKIVSEVSSEIIKLYKSHDIYTQVVSLLGDLFSKSKLSDVKFSDSVKFVTGGERRDWFFSVPLAQVLGLPHLYVYNDGLVLDENAQIYKGSGDVGAVHVADLLTIGSSYTNKWIPYLREHKIQIALSLNCVDRDQGGSINLLNAGVGSVSSLCKIGQSFFMEAKNDGVISDTQYQALIGFFNNQFESMRNYLLSHPDFIKRSLGSDKKTRERMLITINQDLYKLGEEFLSEFKNAG